MNVERMLRLIAGAFVMASVLLGVFVNANFLWFTAFVGANMLQSSFTGFCPLAKILSKLGVPAGHAFGGKAQPAP